MRISKFAEFLGIFYYAWLKRTVWVCMYVCVCVYVCTYVFIDYYIVSYFVLYTYANRPNCPTWIRIIMVCN